MLQSDELPDGCRITRYESIKAKKKKGKGRVNERYSKTGWCTGATAEKIQ